MRSAQAALGCLLLVALVGGAWALWGDMPDEWRQPKNIPQPVIHPGHVPPDDEYRLAEGYRLELVTTGLTYPTAVEFGEDGAVYVVESGYSYGPSVAIPRILRIQEGGWREVARLPDGPVTGLRLHEGQLFAIGGRDPARVWRVDPATGNVTTVLTGFPVWGRHFTSDLAFDADGRMYFAVGDPTNSGVLGIDDYYTYGYLSIFPAARSISCVDLVLHGRNFETENPFQSNRTMRTETGAFQRFGQPAREGQIVHASEAPGCNGAVFRANADGSDLEVFATGIRYVRGLGFAPDGRLLGTDAGMETTGSRPVANACDALWELREGTWYGFPDFACGTAVTDERFRAENRSAPEALLREHPDPPPEPLHRFEPGSGAWSIDFGPDDRLLVAHYGSHFQYPPTGHRVVWLDLKSLEEEELYANLVPGERGTAPDRPIAVRHAPDGSIYLVDFGALSTTTKTFHPSALTGAVWRITTTSEDASAAPDAPLSMSLPLPAGVAAVCAARAAARSLRTPLEKTT